jgi:purine-binding chemotaxis protein CheW
MKMSDVMGRKVMDAGGASVGQVSDVRLVQEIIRVSEITQVPRAPEFIKGVINLRGSIVPIVDLRLKFALACADYDRFTVVIILNIAHRVMGVVVDAVSDVVALAPGEIRPAPQISGSIDSGFIRGLAPVDGRMLIIVDIARLMTSREMALVAEAA